MSDDNLDPNLNVTTDRADYQPGEAVFITASNVAVGASVEFQVAHVQAGEDGIYGTADDLYTYDLTGTGTPWIVTDGSDDDGDGLLNGSILTGWLVNEDALNQSFLLTASELGTGDTDSTAFTDTHTALHVGDIPTDFTGELLLDAINEWGKVYNAVFAQGHTTIPTGTGNIDPFLRMQDDTSKNDPGDLEEGYNSNFRDQGNPKVQFDEDTNAQWNHALLVSAVPVLNGVDVDFDGVIDVTGLFYQFRLDLNEPNSALPNFISLDELQIYLGNTATFHDFVEDEGFYNGGAHDGTPDSVKIYDLDTVTDNWIMIHDIESGSGRADMFFYLPKSLVDPLVAANPYFYFYSAFGEHSDSEATFEEWNTAITFEISGTKFLDLNGDGSISGDPAMTGTAFTINLYDWLDDGDTIVEQIELTLLQTTETSTVDGTFTFTGLIPLGPGHAFYVAEAGETGWSQTFGNNGYIIPGSTNADVGNINFANTQNATKSGVKYEDLNADGDRDAGDNGISGFTIYAFNDVNGNGLLDSGDTAAASTVTGTDGTYSFTLSPGKYIIVEGDKANWFESPDDDTTSVNNQTDGFQDNKSQNGYAITLTSGQVDSDNDFANFRQATKSGVKYEDLNADGDRDAGDNGVSGFTIYAFNDVNGNGLLDTGDTAAASTVTGTDGTYSFSLNPGKYIIVEGDKAGWAESPDDDTTSVNNQTDGFQDNKSQNGYAITLTSAQVDSDNDFANFRQATKSGVKYEDLNADGDRDAGDNGVSGFTIYAFNDVNGNGLLDSGDTAAASTVTGTDGTYSFSLNPGKYIIVEGDKANWFESPDDDTTSVNNQTDGFEDNKSQNGYAITLTSAQVDSDNDFANFRQATKSGVKYEDLNVDGDRDAGENGVSGFTIYAFNDVNGNGLLDTGDTAAASTVTGTDGTYSFSLNPGKYIIVEGDKAGWVESPDDDTTAVNDQTDGFQDNKSQNGYAITLTSAQVDSDNDFANFRVATKSGVKYEDLNADGDRDAGDNGVSGFTIYAFNDVNGNGLLDSGDTAAASTVTGTDGTYSFSLNPGKYIIVEGDKANWFESPDDDTTSVNDQTDGVEDDKSQNGYAITLTSGQVDSDNDFANFRQATKSGVKYEDLNADGDRDAGDNGISGFTIYAFNDVNGNGLLDTGDTAAASTVTGTDGTYSFTLNPGKYIIVEGDKANWFESPDDDTTSVNDQTDGVEDDKSQNGYAITLTSGQVDSDNDFANFRQATKSGVKYEDLNADGDRDAGDNGISGFTIYAFNDVNGNGLLDTGDTAAASTVTGTDGTYSFTLNPGKYIIVEGDKANWFESPDDDTTSVNDQTDGFQDNKSQNGYAITLTSAQVDSDNDFANFRQATKSGVKYEDLNADGDRDAGDNGVSGFTIYAFNDVNGNGLLDTGDTAAASTVTGTDGTYSFSLNPGKYIIVEGDKAGWVESPDDDTTAVNDQTDGFQDNKSQNGYAITLTSAQVDSDNDFANFRVATKSGVKYEDLNADGDRDAGDNGISGFTIYAFNDVNGNGLLDTGDTVQASTVTGTDGTYSFSLNPGKYIIVEGDKANWFESPDDDTTSVNDQTDGVEDDKSQNGYAITLTSGQVDSDNDFANFRQATKSGVKYEDLNADGDRDAGDNGISGFTIYAFNDVNGNGLLDTGDTAAASTVTGTDGTYSFTLNPGKYIIVEGDKANWFESPDDDTTAVNDQTDGVEDDKSQNGYAITLTSGQVDSDNDFANFRQATKSGVKYEDLNADGDRDAGDNGVSGFTIYAFNDVNGNGLLDTGDTAAASTVTGTDGSYSFSLNPGKYIIVEGDKANWFESPDDDTTSVNDQTDGFQDNKSQNGYAITLTSAQVDSDNDFANFRQATKSGVKYEDLNADGDRDAGDNGVSGFTIYAFNDVNGNGLLDTGDTAAASTVTGTDGTYSFSLNPGKYIIVEGDKANWFESPDDDTTSVNDQTDGFQDNKSQNGYAITLTSAQVDSDNDFANFRQATKSGVKYEDLNADGDRDAGDNGVSGFTIYAFNDVNGNGLLDTGDTAAASTVTGTDGTYSFSLNPGKYIIVEGDKANWFESPDDDTTSVNNQTDGVEDDKSQNGYAITLTSNQVDNDNDFANYLNGSIHGFKFNDLSGDGHIDAGEGAMPGITIQLIGDIDGDGTIEASETITTTTDADGKFSFGDLHPGDYTVTELFTDNGVTWGTTVDHDNDGVGDNTTQVTVQSGQELVAFQADIAGIPAPQHGVLADLDGYDLIFGNIEVGGCGLSPGFWANHLYVWDGIDNNGPRDQHGTGEYLANKLVADGTIVEPEMLDLFPGTVDFPAGVNVDGNDKNAQGTNIGPHNDIVIKGSGTQYFVIQWDDAQELIAGNAVKGGDKLPDFVRMTINAYLDDLGVPGFNAPAGLLTSAADWLLANAPATLWATDNDYHILKYNNLTEANNGASSAQDGPKDGFNGNPTYTTIKASSAAWQNGGVNSGASIFENLTKIICDDDASHANNTGSTFSVSGDGSIVVLGICHDEWFGVIDATSNIPGGYNLL